MQAYPEPYLVSKKVDRIVTAVNSSFALTTSAFQDSQQYTPEIREKVTKYYITKKVNCIFTN